MSEYDPLRTFLAAGSGEPITLTFAQIDHLVGTLPPSAHEYQVWWDNAPAQPVVGRRWLHSSRRSCQRAGHVPPEICVTAMSRLPIEW